MPPGGFFPFFCNAPPPFSVYVEGDALTLNPGGWIYEVRAGWDRMPDFEGNSSYTVLIRME